VPVGHLDESVPQDWDALQSRARDAVVHRLRDMGIIDLEKHIKFEISYTPHDWQRMFNLAKGAAFGLGHQFSQVGYLRPRNRHRRYGNLYFCGASTHPGTGVPIVLLSARLVEERILKEQPMA
jgi:phytoene dehydrogenase-like protein